MNVVLKQVPCSLCGNKEYWLRSKKPFIWMELKKCRSSVVECDRCGLILVYRRLTLDSIKRYYPGEYHYNRRGEEWKFRYESEAECVGRYCDENVLDIGCDLGEFSSYLINKSPIIEKFEKT